MQPFDRYIDKHDVNLLFPRKKHRLPTELVVVIPCFDETDLETSLNALLKCEFPGCRTEVIVVVNSGENAEDDILITNRETYFKLLAFKEKYSSDTMGFNPVLIQNIRKKHAGVGMARKIGMDQAVLIFREEEQENGIILSLDADTVVERNYLSAIRQQFMDKKLELATIDFQHLLAGSEFEQKVYDGILLYELHLRYVRLAMKVARFPYDMHTIGSAFAVSASAYVKHGGMNRRQGGEDFYFLHKLRPHSKYMEILDTTVHPSPRPSERVPFGTGPQIAQWCRTGELNTYDFNAFKDLSMLFTSIDRMFGKNEGEIKLFIAEMPESIQAFIQEDDFMKSLDEINRNAASLEGFYKRFFLNFNAFKVIRYLNFAHSSFYQKQDVEAMCNELFGYYGLHPIEESPKTCLKQLRDIEKAGI